MVSGQTLDMCGILYTNASYKREKFKAALQLLDHRGPDAEGYYQTGQHQLGHKRLKIIDMNDRSNQPFFSKDGRYLLIYNGEIYNYLDLARTYGFVCRTSSDTEVLLELYIHLGPSFVNHLEGMFAFVVVDTVTDSVFIARDRLGVKPLYLYKDKSTISVSSEIAPLLELTGISKIDEVGLRQYRKLRTFFNSRTLYSGIEIFPAGHYMINGILYRYWSLPDDIREPPTDEELYNLIVASIQKRLVGDVAYGSYLSGGLDSTIITKVSRATNTWTVGFADDNEFYWGRMAAFGTDAEHHEILIEYTEFLETAKEIVRKRREPLSVPNEVLLFKMTKEAKRKNTIILSGEGADELFFGYDRIFRWASKAKYWDLKKFAELYAYGSHSDLEIVEDAISPFLYLKEPIDIVAHFFQIAHLHGLLIRLDSSTMMSSVEARVPFVDAHQLVERMAGVSFAYRIQDGVVKAPLKRIFKDILPNEIIAREKVGFPVPLAKIFESRDELLSPMDSWLDFNLNCLGII